jgi:serine/threonine protein kinase/tetratricopeptide (TPR) repeat protein
VSEPDLPSRYLVRSLLGEGGAGRVYRVLDRLAGSELALKVVGEAEVSFLRREFETLRQVRHANLVNVKEWSWLASGCAYYTMELVAGEDLGRRIGVPIPCDEVLRILAGVLRGLAHLHSHKQLHGDLKPANILLGPDGLIKVSDVGMGASSDHTRSVTGTPGYTAPEVWSGSAGDERSDIYSAGVIAYEALTGKHPFIGRTVRDVVAGQMEGWVPSISSHGITIPPDLERALMRALERTPSLRHQLVDDFMDDLGVSDKVGDILGGRFVGRERELGQLDSLVETRLGPQLTWICGPNGSGRSALVAEWCHRMAETGSLTLTLDSCGGLHEERLLTSLLSQLSYEPVGPAPRSIIGDSLSLAARALAAASHNAPVFIVWDSRMLPLTAGALGFARNLVRRVRDDAPEKPFVLFVLTESLPSELAESEQVVTPSFLGLQEVGNFVEGLLGALEWNDGTLARLHRLTGGLPGLVRDVVLDLVSGGTLERSAGRWHFRETEPVDAMAFTSLQRGLSHTLASLRDWDRSSLLAMAITRAPIDIGVLTSAFGSEVSLSLQRGQQRGWLVNTDGQWALSSELVRSVVLAASEETQRVAIARLLLGRRGGLGRECLAELLLLAGEAEEACAIGLEAALQASERGQHAVAESRLRAILRVGTDVLEKNATATVVLKLAGELNVQGKHVQAIEVLSAHRVWGELRSPSSQLASRAHLLGQLYISQGDLDNARHWLTEAARDARAIGELPIWLRAQADLTQLDWERGTGSDRSDAIASIRQVLTETEGVNGVADERVALLYGLGAALLLAGDREEGKAVLLAAFQRECSSYWKMRIANALAAASTMLGEYLESLEWSRGAWQWSEKAGADSFKARILSNRGALFHSMGRYRESAEENTLAVEWAQKTDNIFEYESGLAGAAINNILLARYEDALRQAQQGRLLARRSKNELNAAKSAELEAMVHYYLGDLAAALSTVDEGRRILENREYVETRPRLDWLRGRIMAERGETDPAIELVAKAEQGLLQCTDLEDLLGIQVELANLRRGSRDWRVNLRDLSRLLTTARDAGVLLAHLGGAVAIGEIIAGFCPEDEGYDDLLQGALALADGSGVLEASWQLDGSIGLIAQSRGARRSAHASMNRAVRTIRETSERLDPARRQMYIKSGRVQRRLVLFTNAM